MAKRMKKRKKKKGMRLGRLLILLLPLCALVLVLILVLRSARTSAPTPNAGDGLWDGSWYEDDLARIDSDKALVKGMEAFRRRTGVQPFLTLLGDMDPEELSVFAQDQYEALFADNGHVLVVYDEWEDGTYYLSAWTGERSALTQADVSFLLDSIETAYADPANKTYAEAFGKGFSNAAKGIVVGSRAASGVVILLILGILLILLSGVLILFLRKRIRDARRREEELFLD